MVALYPIPFILAIKRLSIKHIFYDSIEYIYGRIKGYRNTKENLHDLYPFIIHCFPQ